jgi:hypothetical protein
MMVIFRNNTKTVHVASNSAEAHNIWMIKLVPEFCLVVKPLKGHQ